MAIQPRDAATVILARPAAGGGFDVLMTRRPDTMRFMGGTYVFPGGALDPDDCAQTLAGRSRLSASQAQSRIGEDLPAERALGLHCCAVRELFEEVGVLLARDARSGAPVDPALVHQRYAAGHAAGTHSPGAFAGLLEREGLVLATDELVHFGRLITPEASPIRFDARFFAVRMPDGQQLVLDPHEVPEAVWITPAEAIDAAERERMAVPIPTMTILQELIEVPDIESLTASRSPDGAAR